MQHSFNKALPTCFVFLIMNRCILVVFIALFTTASFGQSDFIQLKKKNKVIQTWFKDNYIYVQLKSDQWINAVIYNIKDDSLYLRPYVVQTYINRIGLNYLDTTFYGLMQIHINYIKAFPKDDEGLAFIKNGALFKIAGGGYALLNIINTLSDNDPPFGSDNLPKLAVAAGVFAVGVILGITHETEYIIGKKYHLEYISVKRSS
jgi:hypothetical protein